MNKSTAVDESKRVRKILKKIKSFNAIMKYICIPDPTLHRPSCALLEEKLKGITKTEQIEDYRWLNMPYIKGRTLSDYFKRKHNFGDIYKFLLELFENAIIPLNNLGVYHLDITSNNIMIKEKMFDIIDTFNKKKLPDPINNVFELDTQKWEQINEEEYVEEDEDDYEDDIEAQYGIRALNLLKPYKLLSVWLIDFGSSRTDHDSDCISEFMFNVPFSNILLDKTFGLDLDDFIMRKSTGENRRNYLFIKQTYNSCYGYIDNNKAVITKKIHPDPILKNLLEYMPQNRMDIDGFIKEYIRSVMEMFDTFKSTVYLKNADIWGFLMCYSSVYGSEIKVMLLNLLIFKYCYNLEYATQPFPIEQIKAELNAIKEIE
jgi:serine/threonine protein kinase